MFMYISSSAWSPDIKRHNMWNMNVNNTLNFVQSIKCLCPKLRLWKSDVSSLLTSWAKGRKWGILSKDRFSWTFCLFAPHFMLAYYVFLDILLICITACNLIFPPCWHFEPGPGNLTFWARQGRGETLPCSVFAFRFSFLLRWTLNFVLHIW